MPAEISARCGRCYANLPGEPFLMAGRVFCCETCSVGSVCEHQGIHRPPSLRRYDTMFDPFREVSRHGSPYAFDRPGTKGGSHA